MYLEQSIGIREEEVFSNAPKEEKLDTVFRVPFQYVS